MSSEFEDYLNEASGGDKKVRQKILDEWASSGDDELKQFASNAIAAQQKEQAKEVVQTQSNLFTQKHHALGISPADVLMYGIPGAAAVGVGLKAGTTLGGKAGEYIAEKAKDLYSQATAPKQPVAPSPVEQAQQRLADIQTARPQPPVQTAPSPEQIRNAKLNAAAQAAQSQMTAPPQVAPAQAPQPAAQPPATPATTYNQPLAQVPGMPPQVAPAQAPAAPVQPPIQAAAPVAPVAAPAPAVEAPAGNIPTSVDATGKQASWVIKDKTTGQVVMETFDPAKVNALNTAKYEAVPIQQHLASINKSPVAPVATPAAQSLPQPSGVSPSILESAEYKALESKYGPHTAVTGSGMPAWEGKGQMTLEEIRAANKRLPKGGVYESLEQVPAKQAVVPGGQYFDEFANMIGNREAAQGIVRQMGRYPTKDEMKSIVADYMKANNIKSRAENLAAGLSKEEAKSVVPGVFSTIGSGGKKTATLGKALGVGAGMLAFADLAKAAQQTKEGQYGEAAKTVAPVIDPTGLATAAISPKETSQMLSNVSPIIGILSQLIGAESETKAKREQARKAGAGRGTVPASAYQR